MLTSVLAAPSALGRLQLEILASSKNFPESDPSCWSIFLLQHLCSPHSRMGKIKKKGKASASIALYDLETDMQTQEPRAPHPITIPDRKPFASSRFRSATLDDCVSSRAYTHANRDRKSVCPNPQPRAPPSTTQRTSSTSFTNHYSPNFVIRRHSQRRYQKHLVAMRSVAQCG